MAKKKNTIKDQLEDAKKQMEAILRSEEEILETIKKKTKKTKRKTVKEQYQEIKESLKPKVLEEPEGEDYEQFLVDSLFEGEERKEHKEDSPIIETKPVREKTGLWDYTLEDEIKFFDPECSYEITKYRPITETQGLDFDPEPFCEMARLYESTGMYTQYPEGSKPYNDFWTEQIRRCQEGYEVNGFRITGDNYFFLNFYRMQTVVEGRTAGKGRNESFPSFFAKQYEFFHYVEMAEKLHKDVGILKARGL